MPDPLNVHLRLTDAELAEPARETVARLLAVLEERDADLDDRQQELAALALTDAYLDGALYANAVLIQQLHAGGLTLGEIDVHRGRRALDDDQGETP